MRTRFFAAVVAAVMLGGACVSPADEDRVDPATRGPARDLAAKAESLPSSSDAPTSTTDSSLPGSGVTTTTDGSGSPQTTTTAAKPPRTLVDATDRSGDAGVDARPYGDAARITFEEVGDNLAVTVTMRGELPARLASGEVMGVGVDVFRTGGQESDYQLFADGGDEGWFAYLQTPEGFVDYPGSFGVGGSRLVFTVPWASIGGRAAAEASLFVDWSKEATVRNLVSADRVPDKGKVQVRP